MRSPVLAIIWQQWRNVRWVLILAYFALTAAAVGGWATGEDGEVLKGVFCFAIVIVTVFAMTFQGDMSNLQTTFSTKLFSLPVRTHVLVNCVLVSRLLAIGSVVGVTWCLHRVLFGPLNASSAQDGRIMPFAVALLFLAVCAQAVLWWPGWSVLVRVVVIALFCVYLIMVVAYVDPVPRLLFFTAALVGAYCVSLAGVVFDRRGARAPVLTMAMVRYRQKSEGVRVLKTPASAQLWFEWMTRGRLMPVFAVLCSLLIFAGTCSLMVIGGRRSVLRAISQALDSGLWTLFSLVNAPGLAALIVGMLMVKIDHKESVSGISTFAFTRPMSTRKLAVSRLRMGVKSLCSMYLVLVLTQFVFGCVPQFLLLLAGVFTGGDHVAGMSAISAFDIVVIFIAQFAVCWALLWLAFPIVITVAVLNLLIGLAFMLADMLGVPGVNAADFADAVWCVVAVVAVAASVWGFVRAWRRGLVSVRCLCVLAVVWPVLASAFIEAASEIGIATPYGSWSSMEGTLTAFAFALLPLLPFATVPLTIEWFRHR